MKRVLCSMLIASSVAAYADEEAETTPVADAESAQAVKAPAKASFMTLPLCRRIEGEVLVRPFGAKEWAAAEEGRFYPLGSSFKTTAQGNGRLTLAFAANATVSIAGDAEFSTRAQGLGVATRTITLVRGTVNVKLPDNLPEGAFFVTAPAFLVKNPAGESQYVYEDMGDGDKVTVLCKTGSLGLEGRHYAIPTMRAANTVVIRTSRDQLSTFLYGKSGDYIVKLDKDQCFKDEIDDNGQVNRKLSREFCDFHLSPGTKVIINRSIPKIGERMSAFIMAFDASGERQGLGISTCQDRPEINNGDLGNKEKLSEGELAKLTAAASETTETTDSDESNSDEKSSESNSDSNE